MHLRARPRRAGGVEHARGPRATQARLDAAHGLAQAVEIGPSRHEIGELEGRRAAARDEDGVPSSPAALEAPWNAWKPETSMSAGNERSFGATKAKGCRR